MLLYVCWKWNDTVTRHDCLELLFSQWRKQMGKGPAEQKAQLWSVADTTDINEDTSHRGSNNVLPDNKPEALPVIQPRL